MINLRKLLFLLSFLSLTNISLADNGDVLRIPIAKLQYIAQQINVLDLARQQDGQLSIDEIFEHAEVWSHSKQQRYKLLDKAMQRHFKSTLEQNPGVFVGLLLMGSQGEVLAAYPQPSSYWHGAQAKFINVMADENPYVDDLNWNDNKSTLDAQISVPVQDAEGIMYGVLSAHIKGLVVQN